MGAGSARTMTGAMWARASTPGVDVTKSPHGASRGPGPRPNAAPRLTCTTYTQTLKMMNVGRRLFVGSVRA